MFIGNQVQQTLGLSANGRPSVRYNHAIDHRDFDIDMYNDIKDMSPLFQNTLDAGNDRLKTFSNLSEDIFLNLFKWNPKMRDINEVAPSRRFNHQLLNELNQTEEFQKLRGKCRVNMLNSAIGTEIIQTKALDKVNTIIREYNAKLEEAKRNGVPQDQLPQNIIDKINELADMEANGGTPYTGDPNDPFGSGNSGGNQLPPELAKQLAEAQQKLENTPEAEALQQQIQQALREATQEALNDVSEMDDFIEAWGIEPGGDNRVSVDECKDALERIRGSNELSKLTELLGRFRSIAKTNLKHKSKGEGGVIKNVGTGNDIVKMLPSEKALMSTPSTKALFKKKYVEKQCLQYEVENNKRKGMGPIIVAVDSSGSMSGKRMEWAKATALALLEIATKQKRNFYIYFFDTKVKKNRTWSFEKGQVKPATIIDIAQVDCGGGTNFSVPVHKAMDIISKEKGFKKADITFITDGDCTLYDEQVEEVNKMKKERNVKIQTIIINMDGHCSKQGVEEWSDSVRTVSSLADMDGALASDLFNFAIDG